MDLPCRQAMEAGITATENTSRIALNPPRGSGQFSERYAEWIAAQNAAVEKHGIWSDQLLAW
jgi:endonuclease YncB( thermonuclease family)